VPKRGQAVLHSWRDDRINRAYDQAVTFHLTNGFGEHLLTDLSNQFSQAGKPDRAMLFENFEDEHGPLVCNASDNLADQSFDPGIDVL
jgi:hypothetical protein